MVTMLRGGLMLDIIFKMEATGFSDKLDVKHERHRFFFFFSSVTERMKSPLTETGKTIGGQA